MTNAHVVAKLEEIYNSDVIEHPFALILKDGTRVEALEMLQLDVDYRAGTARVFVQERDAEGTTRVLDSTQISDVLYEKPA